LVGFEGFHDLSSPSFAQEAEKTIYLGRPSKPANVPLFSLKPE
jgi:hypothetical protein